MTRRYWLTAQQLTGLSWLADLMRLGDIKSTHHMLRAIFTSLSERLFAS
jgi:hypothetical protein